MEISRPADCPIPTLLWAELDGRLWHATSPARLAEIVREGEISPSAERDHQGSFSDSIGAISLFDFGSSAIDHANQFRNVVGWLGDHQKSRTAIWLELDRGQLGENFLDAKAARAMWQQSRGVNFIPGFEACHRGPIPIGFVRRALLIGRDHGHPFRSIEIGPVAVLEAIVGFEAGLAPEPDRSVIETLQNGRVNMRSAR